MSHSHCHHDCHGEHHIDTPTVNLTVINKPQDENVFPVANLVAGSNVYFVKDPIRNTLTINTTVPAFEYYKFIKIEKTDNPTYTYSDGISGTVAAEGIYRDFTFVQGDGIDIDFNPQTRRIRISNNKPFNGTFPELTFFDKVRVTNTTPVGAIDWVTGLEVNAAEGRGFTIIGGRNISVTTTTNPAVPNALKIDCTYNPPLLTKGDILVYANAPTRLPVGNDNQVLISDYNSPMGVRWANLSEVNQCNSYLLFNQIPLLDRGKINISGNLVRYLDNELTDSHNFIVNHPLTTKGDLFTMDPAGATRIGVGSSYQLLMADPEAPTGLRWICLCDVAELSNYNANTYNLQYDGTDITDRVNLNFSGNLISYIDNSTTDSINFVINHPLTAKGDLFTATASGAARLPVGSNNYVLAADNTSTTGLKWISLPDLASAVNLSVTGQDITFLYNSIILSSYPNINFNGNLITHSPNATTGTHTFSVNHPLNTKGDIFTYGTSSAQSHAVGSNNQVLIADSSTSTGLRWTSLQSLADSINLTSTPISPLTSKGDLYVYGSSDTRQSVGNDNQVLIADSSTPTGLRWTSLQSLADSISLTSISTSTPVTPLTTKGDIYVYGVIGETKLELGADEAILVADSSTPTGLRWSTDYKYLSTNMIPDTETTHLLTAADQYKRHYYSTSTTIVIPQNLPVGWQCELCKASFDDLVLLDIVGENPNINFVTSGSTLSTHSIQVSRRYGVIHLVVITYNTVHVTGGLT